MMKKLYNSKVLTKIKSKTISIITIFTGFSRERTSETDKKSDKKIKY